MFKLFKYDRHDVFRVESLSMTSTENSYCRVCILPDFKYQYDGIVDLTEALFYKKLVGIFTSQVDFFNKMYDAAGENQGECMVNLVLAGLDLPKIFKDDFVRRMTISIIKAIKSSSEVYLADHDDQFANDLIKKSSILLNAI